MQPAGLLKFSPALQRTEARLANRCGRRSHPVPIPAPELGALPSSPAQPKGSPKAAGAAGLSIAPSIPPSIPRSPGHAERCFQIIPFLAYPTQQGCEDPAAVQYTSFLSNRKKSALLPPPPPPPVIFERSRSPACLLLSLAGHVSGPAHLRFLTAWSRLSDSRETQMDPRWEGPAKQTSSPPCQNTQLRGTHPRLAACSLPAPRCCQAARQLMSPGTHLPAPRRPPDINLLNTRDLFMAGSDSEAASSSSSPNRPALCGTSGSALRLEIGMSSWLHRRINFPKVSPRT